MELTNDREFKVQRGKFKGFAFWVSGSCGTMQSLACSVATWRQ